MLRGYLAVMFVGSFGCAARMGLSDFVAQRYGEVFPVGTLAVNVLGCLFIGLFAGMIRPEGGLLIHPVVRQAVVIGFFGGFTTFSSFGLQTITLFESGEWVYAILNIALSLALCLIATWVGQVVALRIVPD
jgi:CrcB protein